MFNKRDDRDVSIAAAVEVMTKASEAGAFFVTHDDMANAIGCSPPDRRYYAWAMSARKRFMQIHGIWTREEPGVGFRFLSADQSLTDEQGFRRKRARRQLGIASSVAQCVPDESLTEHQRRVKAHAIESHERLRKEMRTEEKLEEFLFKPTPSNRPIRVIPPRS